MGKMEKKELDYYYANVPNKTAELLKAEKTLNEYKKTLPKQKAVRINRNTTILVDANLTEKHVNKKIEKWNNVLNPKKPIYND